jgi:hypothetical protein
MLVLQPDNISRPVSFIAQTYLILATYYVRVILSHLQKLQHVSYSSIVFTAVRSGHVFEGRIKSETC